MLRTQELHARHHGADAAGADRFRSEKPERACFARFQQRAIRTRKSNQFSREDSLMPVESFFGPESEADFAEWRKRNRDGFFINSHNPPQEIYLVLHRADCGSIDTGRRTTYLKTCSATLDELRLWVVEQGFDTELVTDRCPSCQPPPF